MLGYLADSLGSAEEVIVQGVHGDVINSSSVLGLDNVKSGGMQNAYLLVTGKLVAPQD